MADLGFVVSVAAQIRQTILENLRSRYLALGKDLSVDQDTDPFNWADALSIVLEDIEARALALVDQIFPDTSSETYLLKHGDVISLPRKPATPAILTILATGTSGSTFATSDILASPSGVQYAPVVGGVIGGGGSVSIDVQAQTTGTGTNQDNGTLLTWVSAPAGINTAATVTTTAFVASDIETLTDYAQRILEWWRERPGSGNRADFQGFAESRDGISKAYIYPMTHVSLGSGTLGSVTVSLNGPASQRTVSIPLGVGTSNLNDVTDYILGQNAYQFTGKQIPTFCDPSDINVEIPAVDYQDVVASVTLGTGYSFPFAGTFVKATNAGNTTTRIYVTANPVGIVHVNDLVAIDTTSVSFPHGFERGACQVRSVSVVNSAYIEVSVPLGNVPSDGKVIFPAPANWTAMRDAIIAVFDNLGPSDQANIKSKRFPTTTTTGPSRLYHSVLEASLQSLPGLTGAPAGVAGVVSVSVSTPASNVDPSVERNQLVPGVIAFIP